MYLETFYGYIHCTACVDCLKCILINTISYPVGLTWMVRKYIFILNFINYFIVLDLIFEKHQMCQPIFLLWCV